MSSLVSGEGRSSWSCGVEDRHVNLARTKGSSGTSEIRDCWRYSLPLLMKKGLAGVGEGRSLISFPLPTHLFYFKLEERDHCSLSAVVTYN